MDVVPLTVYANCTAMHTTYQHGVGRAGARDHVTSGTPVTTFFVSTALYDANTQLDRDKDGVVCEAHRASPTMPPTAAGKRRGLSGSTGRPVISMLSATTLVTAVWWPGAATMGLVHFWCLLASLVLMRTACGRAVMVLGRAGRDRSPPATHLRPPAGLR